MSRITLTLTLMLIAGTASAQTVVSQKDKEFKPESLSIKAGQSVRFNNDDNVAHNVTVKAPDGSLKNVGLQKVGEHSDVTFDKAGEHEVKCALHPKMKMMVKVQ